jgi:hypothetical protein
VSDIKPSACLTVSLHEAVTSPLDNQSSYIGSSIPMGSQRVSAAEKGGFELFASLRQQPVYDITVSPPLSLPSSASTTTTASSNLSASPLRFFNHSRFCLLQNPDAGPGRTTGGTSGLREEELPATAWYLAAWLQTLTRQAE